MAVTCPQCRAEYDVTLFTLGRRIRCDCGAWVDVAVGHQQTSEDGTQTVSSKGTGEDASISPDIQTAASAHAERGIRWLVIRHLMLLTFVVACMASIGRLMQPRFPRINVVVHLLLFTLTVGVIGIMPVWFVWNSKRPILYSIGWFVVAACTGCCFAVAQPFYDQHSIIWTTVATTTEAFAVVVSLLVVRSCGYRLVRLPSRRQDKKLVS
jgi:hypothetical protein